MTTSLPQPPEGMGGEYLVNWLAMRDRLQQRGPVALTFPSDRSFGTVVTTLFGTHDHVEHEARGTVDVGAFETIACRLTDVDDGMLSSMTVDLDLVHSLELAGTFTTAGLGHLRAGTHLARLGLDSPNLDDNVAEALQGVRPRVLSANVHGLSGIGIATLIAESGIGSLSMHGFRAEQAFEVPDFQAGAESLRVHAEGEWDSAALTMLVTAVCPPVTDLDVLDDEHTSLITDERYPRLQVASPTTTFAGRWTSPRAAAKLA